MGVSESNIRRRVHFYEVDSAGIVHFSWYYRYMEEAEQALWRAAGLSARPTADLAYPRVAAAFEFKRPLRFDDEFDIALRVAAIGRTSISYACTLWRDDDEIAAGTMTIVCVGGGANGGRPVAVPQSIREALTA